MDTINNMLAIQSWSALGSGGTVLIKGLFGVGLPFILGFFLKLFLLFAASAIISKIIGLDKVYNGPEDPVKN